MSGRIGRSSGRFALRSAAAKGGYSGGYRPQYDIAHDDLFCASRPSIDRLHCSLGQPSPRPGARPGPAAVRQFSCRCAIHKSGAAAVPAAATVPAIPGAPVVKGPPLQVQVGILLLNVGRLDTSTGTYTMDFYLTMRCDRPCDPEPFELANGRITFQQLQEQLPTFKAFRIQAALSVGMDLRRYPFDRHQLGLVIEDSNRDANALLYVADPARSTMAQDLQVAGWSCHQAFRPASSPTTTRSSIRPIHTTSPASRSVGHFWPRWSRD